MAKEDERRLFVALGKGMQDLGVPSVQQLMDAEDDVARMAASLAERSGDSEGSKKARERGEQWEVVADNLSNLKAAYDELMGSLNLLSSMLDGPHGS